MSFRVKRSIVVIALLLWAAWPTAHYFVVRRMDLNPWNWFGWAMYTQPSDRLMVEAYAPNGDALSSLLDTITEQQGASIMSAYRPWSLRHLELGEFDDPDEFATAILRVFRSWGRVRVEVRRFGLDRETATVGRKSVRSYEYTRAGLGLD